MKRLHIPVLCVLFVCMTAFVRAEPLVIYGLKGPSGVGLIRLFENPPVIPGFEVKTEALAQADLMAAKILAGEAKIGILPSNTAAKIASSGKKIQLAAVTGTGMLSLISADASVKRLEDLRGKTVEVAGHGATPDYVFRKILLAKGLTPEKDVLFGHSLAYPEIAQSLIAGRLKLALLPEPFATMALAGNKALFTIGNIQEEWRRAVGAASAAADYPMTVLVVDADFAAAHPAAVKIILRDVKDSIDWVKANPAAAGPLVEKHALGLKAPVVSAAIPKSGYVFIPAAEARPALEALYRVFLEFSPSSIGGKLPDGDFYYR